MTDDVRTAVREKALTIEGHWNLDDPPVLEIPGEKDPVIAHVGPGLRLMHSGLVYAQEIDIDDIVDHLRENNLDVGHIDINYMSDYSARFTKTMFTDLPPANDDDEEGE